MYFKIEMDFSDAGRIFLKVGVTEFNSEIIEYVQLGKNIIWEGIILNILIYICCEYMTPFMY